MSDFKPRTRTEQFLAAATGDYTGELPKPITKEQEYLEKLVALLSNGSGSGGGSVDLSAYAKKEEVAQAIESAHTHTNKSTLDRITAAKFTSWESAVQQIGDIQTALAAIVEVEA